ncbi:cytochrome c [Sagittula marina]|uniref:Cytochrome c n=2 Tax=Sagittula marina TaxID=943940 RepID=A0A7W6DTJ1_9RHOB|nr:cytochrome c [Sagittula marina]
MMRWLALVLALASPVSAQEFTTLKGHGGPIMGIAVSPEGRVATASFDNSVGLWDSSEPQWLEGHEAAVNTVIFGPAGVISGADDFTVRGWPEGQIIAQHRGKVTSLALQGGALASGSWDGTIHLTSKTGVQVLNARDGVNAVAFGEGALFAGTSAGALMRYADGAALPLVQHGFGINELIVTSEWIAYGAVDGGTRIIDHDGAEIADVTLDRRPILAMAYHAATHQLAVGDGQGYIMMLDTRDWQISRDFRATRQGPVWALAFSPDGQTIWAGGLDDVVYGWPVEALDAFTPGISGDRSFLRDADTMSNGERQFMRKCSICHALTPGPSRKAGPTLHGVFGRAAATVPGYIYSDTLKGAGIVWTEATINALFDQGPDHYIPGSKMPMQVITGAQDRADLLSWLKSATSAHTEEGDK